LGLVGNMPHLAPRLKPLSHLLTHLWSQLRNSLREMMRFDGEDSKLLITAPVAADMTGNPSRVALLNGLGKRLDPGDKLLVGMIRLSHGDDS
jgi:hypothetical protein